MKPICRRVHRANIAGKSARLHVCAFEQLEQRRLLAITATWGPCDPADEFNPVTDCIEVRNDPDGEPNENDDIYIGMIEHDPDGAGTTYAFGKYVEIMNFGVTVPIKSGSPTGPTVHVRTSEVKHMNVLTFDGNDMIDATGVTAANDYAFENQWLNPNPGGIPVVSDLNYLDSHSREAVTIFGGFGDDTIYGTDFGDCIKGSEFDDDPNLGGDDEIDGGAGNDHIEGKSGSDIIHGDEGDDHLYGGAFVDDAYSSAFYSGADLGDEIYGDEGDDRILGQGGDDTLFGGSGDDEIGGQQGQDDVYGGSGDDSMSGGMDDDNIIYDGELTGDFPESSPAGDLIVETEFNQLDPNDAILFADIYKGGQSDGITIDLIRADELQQINDFLWLTLEGVAGFTGSVILDVNIERIEGTAFDDIITGNQNANEFIGLSGDDLLCGEAVFDFLDVICDDGSLGTAGGNDVLWGGDGDDSLHGGPGRDTLEGGNHDDLLAGREPRATSEGLTVAELANRFLSHKEQLRDTGELKRRAGKGPKKESLDLGGRFGTNERYTPSISGVMAR